MHPETQCGVRQTANRAKRSLGKWLMLSSTMVSAAAPSLVASASADDPDDSFFVALKQHGIVFGNRDAASGYVRSVSRYLAPPAANPVVPQLSRPRSASWMRLISDPGFHA